MGHIEAPLPSFNNFLQVDDDDSDHDDDSDDGDDEPIEYLYGDLELKIIDTRGILNYTNFVNYLEGKNFKKNVNIDICHYNELVACSKISHNLDHSLEISLAHPVESNLAVRFNFVMGSQVYNGVATLPCRDIDAYNEFKRWIPVSCRRFLAAVKRLPENKDKDEQYIEVLLQVKFTPCEDNSFYKGGIEAQYMLRKSYFPLRPHTKVTLYQNTHDVANLMEILPVNDKKFKRGTCWEDICYALLDARHVVYIAGWTISHKARLDRGPTLTKPLPEWAKDMTLGELLKYKSMQGVEVLLFLWNEHVDIEPAKMGVQAQPITNAEETKLYFEKKEGESHYVKCKLAYYNEGSEPSSATKSHHQKYVIVDEKAFIGVQDLPRRRYGANEPQLYHDRDDFLNPTFPCMLEGPTTYDVLKNFKQLWQEDTKNDIEDFGLKFDNPSVGVLSEDDPESWNVQIFRSIDSRSVKEFSNTPDANEQEALIWEENVVIDRSIQMAYIQAIRSAQYFIYIENQYFSGSLPNQNNGGVNLIPLELALKIASKIRAKEQFSAYVVIPMRPEGDPTSEDFELRQTMQMMYKIIAKEIKLAKLPDVHPTNYLNFYCLVKRHIPRQDDVNKESLSSHKNGRFMIYVQSNNMIVDDAYLILGSADISQRSMDGSKDIEIAIGAYQPNYTCSLEKQHPRGQVYRYRMSLWQKHLKEIDAMILESPEKQDCVNHVNCVADSNWEKYTTNNDQFTALEGLILKYPVEVDDDGNVKPNKATHEIFIDIVGQVSNNKPDNALSSVGDGNVKPKTLDDTSLDVGGQELGNKRPDNLVFNVGDGNVKPKSGHEIFPHVGGQVLDSKPEHVASLAKIKNILHGDLEVRIINEERVEDRGIFYQYSGRDGQTYKVDNNSVQVAVSPGGDNVGFAAIHRNFNDSAGELILQISVAHCLSQVDFRVKFELNGMLKYSGKATVDRKSIGMEKVETSLVREDSLGGCTSLDIKIRLELKFTACNQNPLYKGGIGAQYALRKSYFPLWPGGKVTLYQDSHYTSHPMVSDIQLENGIFKRGTCWEDLCHAILDANKVVYIIGWAIYHKVRLVRDPTQTTRLDGWATLGDLLKYKSCNGVKVRLLAWDEITSLNIAGVKRKGNLKTSCKHIKSFFKNTSVECVLDPRNPWDIPKMKTNFIFSHHQNCVIVDENDKISAFIGGRSLFSRCYDTPDHQLYINKYKGDFLSPTVKLGTKAPRKPRHDLHCKIEGPAAYDVLKNFKQRWKEATKKDIEDQITEFDYPSSCVLPEYDSESWNIQIYRSIDSGSIKELSTISNEIEQEGLIREEKMVIDRSIQMTYIQAIRSAQHFIYIESHFFIGSISNRNKGVNLIPLELALKIASKIRSKERFCVYVVISMWPKGSHKLKSVQKILNLQMQTMQMMYKIISEEIKSVGLDNVHPADYLNFYCLGKQASLSQDRVNNESFSSHNYGRFMIYVHSKGMIVDDAYMILGSANINHRSMDGSKNTEIAMGAYQPHYTWTTEKKYGQIYGYRMSLWAEHFGLIHDYFKNPETLSCVKYVNHAAKKNWKRFIGDKFDHLKGHILKYPIKVNYDGHVTPIHDLDTFPVINDGMLGAPRWHWPDLRWPIIFTSLALFAFLLDGQVFSRRMLISLVLYYVSPVIIAIRKGNGVEPFQHRRPYMAFKRRGFRHRMLWLIARAQKIRDP